MARSIVGQLDLGKMFMAQVNTCSVCGEMRLMLCYHMFSEKMQEVFKEFGAVAEYLYCRNCDEFSVLFD